MTVIELDDAPSDLKRSVKALEQQLVQLSKQLHKLHVQIMEGNTKALQGSDRTLREIREWLRIGMEIEAREKDERRRENGTAKDYAIDLGAARASIGCRLDRLRQCRGAK